MSKKLLAIILFKKISQGIQINKKPGGSQFLLQNRLGKVAKDAFSSGVETTLPCEQVTIGVTSFGELLYQRRSQRRPKQKRDLYSTECIRESQRNKET